VRTRSTGLYGREPEAPVVVKEPKTPEAKPECPSSGYYAGCSSPRRWEEVRGSAGCEDPNVVRTVPLATFLDTRDKLTDANKRLKETGAG